jgi:hypothetical protein
MSGQRYERERINEVPGVGVIRAWGETVPSDGAEGYAPGCIFQQVDATTVETCLYVNVGTKSSANFDQLVNTDYNNRFTVSTTLAGAASATAANYGKFFIAPRACTVTKISEVHTTAGSDGSAVTLTVERLQGTETSGNGDDLLGTTKINLKGTAETVQSPDLTSTTASLTLAAGDRLNLIDTGTLTSVAGVCVTVELEWVVS